MFKHHIPKLFLNCHYQPNFHWVRHNGCLILQPNKRDGASERNVLPVMIQSKVEVHKILGDFRFEYEYKTEYENDFSILVCRLQIITTQTHLIHELPSLPKTLTLYVAQGL